MTNCIRPLPHGLSILRVLSEFVLAPPPHLPPPPACCRRPYRLPRPTSRPRQRAATVPVVTLSSTPFVTTLVGANYSQLLVRSSAMFEFVADFLATAAVPLGVPTGQVQLTSAPQEGSITVNAVAYAADAAALGALNQAVTGYVADPGTALGAPFLARYGATGATAVEGTLQPPLPPAPSSGGSYKLRVHGYMMIVAWVVLFPIGSIVAHNKWLFPETATVLNKQMWFIVHVGTQLSGLVFLVTGFTFAWKFLDPVEGSSGKAHQVIGTLVFSLTLLQFIIAALLRPAIGTPRRLLWAAFHHWAGRLLILLAWINVFIGIGIAARYINLAAWLAPTIVAMALLVTVYIILHLIRPSAEVSESESSAGAKPRADMYAVNNNHDMREKHAGSGATNWPQSVGLTMSPTASRSPAALPTGATGPPHSSAPKSPGLAPSVELSKRLVTHYASDREEPPSEAAMKAEAQREWVGQQAAAQQQQPPRGHAYSPGGFDPSPGSNNLSPGGRFNPAPGGGGNNPSPGGGFNTSPGGGGYSHSPGRGGYSQPLGGYNPAPGGGGYNPSPGGGGHSHSPGGGGNSQPPGGYNPAPGGGGYIPSPGGGRGGGGGGGGSGGRNGEHPEGLGGAYPGYSHSSPRTATRSPAQQYAPKRTTAEEPSEVEPPNSGTGRKQGEGRSGHVAWTNSAASPHREEPGRF
ncbi:hypothetical protein FOA52_011499 [Chlamydomonas sp. UWO 241]|nr:hypothetical protein FOA52_011499 [Chlamydomonas sp. UWO 241]